tara:strand:+ start:104 stop:298 length:195 start_codon:yes stop_codon:yes gene_type:complete
MGCCGSKKAIEVDDSKVVHCEKGHECYFRDKSPTGGSCDGECLKRYKKGERGTYKCDECNYTVC